MKISKYFVLILICVLLTGCTTFVKPEKSALKLGSMKPISSTAAIHVVVPEKNLETNYLVPHNVKHRFNVDDIRLNMTDIYGTAKASIEDVLTASNVPLSNSSQKSLEFTITGMEWRHPSDVFKWCEMYIDFDIVTGNGYKKHYQVVDATTHPETAMESVIALAVQKIFEDEQIISYINSN